MRITWHTIPRYGYMAYENSLSQNISHQNFSEPLGYKHPQGELDISK